MNLESNFNFDFGNLNDFYYKLLSEEDYDFKTKDIKIDITKDDTINVKFVSSSILELKIATSALIRTLEIIDKTNNIN